MRTAKTTREGQGKHPTTSTLYLVKSVEAGPPRVLPGPGLSDGGLGRIQFATSHFGVAHLGHPRILVSPTSATASSACASTLARARAYSSVPAIPFRWMNDPTPHFLRLPR